MEDVGLESILSGRDGLEDEGLLGARRGSLDEVALLVFPRRVQHLHGVGVLVVAHLQQGGRGIADLTDTEHPLLASVRLRAAIGDPVHHHLDDLWGESLGRRFVTLDHAVHRGVGGQGSIPVGAGESVLDEPHLCDQGLPFQARHPIHHPLTVLRGEPVEAVDASLQRVAGGLGDLEVLLRRHGAVFEGGRGRL